MTDKELKVNDIIINPRGESFQVLEVHRNWISAVSTNGRKKYNPKQLITVEGIPPNWRKEYISEV